MHVPIPTASEAVPQPRAVCEASGGCCRGFSRPLRLRLASCAVAVQGLSKIDSGHDRTLGDRMIAALALAIALAQQQPAAQTAASADAAASAAPAAGPVPGVLVERRLAEMVPLRVG